MTNLIKTAVIGVGQMGRHHARVYAELDHCELAGVFDTDAACAQAIADQYGCRRFPSFDAVLDAGLDAVSVAVPTSLHAALVIPALERGLHVLVEKPLAATRSEGRALIRAAAACRRKLMVGHIERFNPAIQTIKASVTPEEIIAINVVRVGPLPPRIKDAGVVKDMGVHDIDLVHFLTEADVEAVYAVTTTTHAVHEDAASILLQIATGAAAQITTNWITPYKAREIQVITADRLVKADLLTQQVQSFSRFSDQDQSYIVRDLFVRKQEPLRNELQAFLDAIRLDQPVPVTGADGLRALEVALQVSAFAQAPQPIIYNEAA